MCTGPSVGNYPAPATLRVYKGYLPAGTASSPKRTDTSTFVRLDPTAFQRLDDVIGMFRHVVLRTRMSVKPYQNCMVGEVVVSSRTVVLHYHLFKNAGTSLDRLLRDNFGSSWLTREFGMATQNNTFEVRDWIAATPHGIAYSTHTAMGPLPQVDGVTVVPIMMLRDPVDRIISAYYFERKQQVDNLGTRLARENNLEGYVRARLARPNDRQCRNFYSHRLASLVCSESLELDRAIQGLSLLHAAGVVGRVEDFDGTLARLSERLRPHFPEFTWRSTRANVSDRSVAEETSQEVLDLLRSSNQEDFRLLEKLEKLQEASE